MDNDNDEREEVITITAYRVSLSSIIHKNIQLLDY
jgi:hypothetical protein